ncbi:MAG: MinD/ParA family protein [Nanoarchaeota archaeon]
MGKIFGILSLKGGVGKTSSVVALGDAMSSLGKKILLVDGNLSAPNLGLHLNVIDPENTIHHVLSREINPGDAIQKLETFDMIPASIFSNLKFNPLDLKDKIRGLRRRYDAIIIDSSPALNEETLAVMLASDEIVVVTTPDLPSLSTTIKAVKMARNRDTPIAGIIINKAHDENFELSIKDIEESSGVPVLAIIPYDVNIQKSQSEFIPSTTNYPRSDSSREYRKLAGVLIGEKYRPFSLREFFGVPPTREEINREIYYKRYFG